MTFTLTSVQMQLRLKRLMQKHGTIPAATMIPLAAPTEYPVVLEGLAATTDVDHQRMKLRAYAFGYPLRQKFRTVPLLYRHDAEQVAGSIDELDYDSHGQLRIKATVRHDLAKRCGAFSIGARVIDYELKNEDGPDFHALVTCAELLEVSCTNSPANPFALVQRRSRASPQAEYYGNAIALTKTLAKLAALIGAQEVVRHAS